MEKKPLEFRLNGFSLWILVFETEQMLILFFFTLSRFARTCHLGSDGNPTCECPVGYEGRRCEKCAPGYRGNPLIPGDMCVPEGPQCDPVGSLSVIPDPLTGRCRCKVIFIYKLKKINNLKKY